MGVLATHSGVVAIHTGGCVAIRDYLCDKNNPTTLLRIATTLLWITTALIQIATTQLRIATDDHGL